MTGGGAGKSKHPIASCGSVALYLMQNVLTNSFPKVSDSQKELTLKQKGCSARSLFISPFTVSLPAHMDKGDLLDCPQSIT